MCYNEGELPLYVLESKPRKVNKMQTKRVKIMPHARPTEIITPDGRSLGWFVSGLDYWVTPQNREAVERLVARGDAEYVEPSTAPFEPFQLDVEKAEVSGLIKIGD